LNESSDQTPQTKTDRTNRRRPMSTIPKVSKLRLPKRPDSNYSVVRSKSALKDQIGKFYPLPSEERDILCLSVEEIQQIYLAKCDDLDIPYFPDQEKRFTNFCWLHFRNRRFDMSESGIGSKSAGVIGRILRNNTNFAYLNLGKNSIKDSGAIDLLQSLSRALHIVHLDLSSNDITPEGSKTVLKLLENSESIISLNISSQEGLHRNRLCKEGGKALSSFLEKNNVSGTSLGPEGVGLLIKGLSNNLSLASLNLSYNAIGPKAIEKLAITIVATDIKELFLAGNKIGNEGCNYLSLMISGAYEGFCLATKLDISDNEINSEGLSTLLEAARISTQLKSFILKKNNFSGGLSANFLQFLTDNSSVEALDISYCKIKREGFSCMGEGLSRNKTLKLLNLSGNKLCNSCVEVLVSGLAKNKTLKLLDLSSNEISNKGAKSMVKLIKGNETLEVLLLKDNSIKDTGGQALCDAMRFNNSIIKISIELNPLSLQYITNMEEHIKRNEFNKKKTLVPKLNQLIERQKVESRQIDNVFTKINQKTKEKQEAESKLKVQGDKLEGIKETERQKLDELKGQYKEIKSNSYGLSSEIETLQNQLYVMII
jgi:Ran GTPase-activating protein (RanGAP) involved in mRNA processing and transport